jgi:hypothetical protein
MKSAIIFVNILYTHDVMGDVSDVQHGFHGEFAWPVYVQQVEQRIVVKGQIVHHHMDTVYWNALGQPLGAGICPSGAPSQALETSGGPHPDSDVDESSEISAPLMSFGKGRLIGTHMSSATHIGGPAPR